ncbi:hypothetical protein ACLQ3K_21215 [Tsukamurella sp. DT100]|uniref:hypothetical protein n=1 Tax=Tsukamurella sp. DT100 TaxID=3393415 RepID=UPI003CFAAF30
MSAAAKGVPSPKSHKSSSCERALNRECVCGCYSLLHQCDLLDAVLAPLPAVSNGHAVGDEIKNLYGAAFPNLLDPQSKTDVSPARRWVDWATPPGTRQSASQTEQRILDVTLHDVLVIAHGKQRSGKWLPLGNALRAKKDWRSVAGSIAAAMTSAQVLSPVQTRGYFWASMLAATITAADAAGTWPPTAQQIAAAAQAAPTGAPGTNDTANGEPVFARVVYPRAQMPSIIAEIGVPAAVDIAAQVIGSALATATALPSPEARFVVQAVGVTVSPDLWYHPAAV